MRFLHIKLKTFVQATYKNEGEIIFLIKFSVNAESWMISLKFAEKAQTWVFKANKKSER